MHKCVVCKKELQWQAFFVDVRKKILKTTFSKESKETECVCISCAKIQEGKKRKENHCVPEHTFVCSRGGCGANIPADALTATERNNSRSHNRPILCGTCKKKGYITTCIEDWPCHRTGCTARIYPNDLTENQRKNIINHQTKVMCKKCLNEGFTLRTPDPVKCNAKQCGRALPRSNFDPTDMKTEKKRSEAICLECKTKKRKRT